MNLNDKTRFFSKADQSGDCWLWIGANNRGYGTFQLNGKYYRAHRLSWEMVNGIIPDGMCVLHKCDTPACVNPAHLYLGSHADNSADMVQKGRSNRGELNGIAKLTKDSVMKIRDLYVVGGTSHQKLAEQFGVSRRNVGDVINRRLWSHIP